jgi:glycosyltransferase involved in cell wall biosynthesis
VLGLARAQRARGLDVRVVTTTANGDTELPPDVVESGWYEGVPVHYCERGWPRALFRAPGLGPTLHSLIERDTVVHLHGLWNATIWRAARVARQAGRPYVLSPRGMLAPAARRHSALKKRMVYPFLDGPVVARAARLHATSEGEWADLARTCGGDRLVYAPNGVDVPVSRRDVRDARRRLGLPVDDPLVVLLGRLHPIKRLDLLADACAIVRRTYPATRLVIAGPDAQNYRASLATHMGPLGEAVSWLGPVDADRGRDVLAAASVFVMCSDVESFGLTVAEAMAASVPVVVTRTCPWEIVQTRGAGFWVDQRADAMAAAIEVVLGDPDRAATMGERGRWLVEQEYSWPSVAERLEPMYEEVADVRAH